jgi:SAM-dependent methyltransferase
LSEEKQILHINHLFLLNVIDQYAKKNNSLTVLDFGCGGGEIVKSARQKKIKAYGADIFHSGSAIPNRLADENLLGDVIREIVDDTLQFSDETFDLIISNQVFEHVQNLDKALKEINRVLKTSGVLYALFPAKNVFREGHTGIPFLHWFPKNQYRYYYALAMRNLGFGKRSGDKKLSHHQSAESKINYIDTKTYYRNEKEIKLLFNKYFKWEHQEDKLILFRSDQLNNFFGNFIQTLMKMPGFKELCIFAFTRLAGYLIVAKPKYPSSY